MSKKSPSHLQDFPSPAYCFVNCRVCLGSAEGWNDLVGQAFQPAIIGIPGLAGWKACPTIAVQPLSALEEKSGRNSVYVPFPPLVLHTKV